MTQQQTEALEKARREWATGRCGWAIYRLREAGFGLGECYRLLAGITS